MATAPGPSRKRKADGDGSTAPSKRTKRQQNVRDARTLAAQTSSSAFKNGELNLEKFVKAREFEIRALDQGLQRSKKASTTRAFQQVPKDLRRRTASHNAKRVPKRLRSQARREMADDNTPGVASKISRQSHIRLDTVKKLRSLSVRASKPKETPVVMLVRKTKVSRPKQATPRPRNSLADPPLPRPKFRKRQVHKSWLPTHLFHAKRARMTPPLEPLWRFAIPLTPTAKSYRPTHHSSSERGAVAWDTSYMSTIGLRGTMDSLQGLLNALGQSEMTKPHLQRWLSGSRLWSGWLYEPGPEPRQLIAPVTIIWRQAKDPESHGKQHRRTIIIRVHPSAFTQLWTTTVKLASLQKPSVAVDDLRFEIGSIECTGPASTQVLRSALWPYQSLLSDPVTRAKDEHVWLSLRQLINPAMLPSNVLFIFDIADPRLRFPPRLEDASGPPSSVPESQMTDILVRWPLDDQHSKRSSLFDASARRRASQALPSQRTINKRKSETASGERPTLRVQDPAIPCVFYPQRDTANPKRTIWTILLPWKCVQPVWYSLAYCPLSTGGQVRFGGLQEQRQLFFEAGAAWFPGDFPGTEAGDAWDETESARVKADWERRPKGKRVNFESLRLNDGPVGEVGKGWACDWPDLVKRSPNPCPALERIRHVSTAFARARLASQKPNMDTSNVVFTVRITLFARGVATRCARIYRLPRPPSEKRARWLSLQGTKPKTQKGRARPHVFEKGATTSETLQRLARDLLATNKEVENHPEVPNADDLVGFVTTGEFSLSRGKGMAIGSLLLDNVLYAERKARGSTNNPDTDAASDVETLWNPPSNERCLCIVRNAGETVGRLARWELVET